ncbi:hypothetical protein [Cytobacillus kochii]|uniref:hypothetical protein n=1 Tax=Cytobacillus kochii TaxID=859143 RepID=UPI00203D4357|nr:hypothetical protein [Cytobacillus kochii]MCM3322558.1 hypothetical protein [Cytobacillus kochii]MCM3344963.1 hypothetical protein [Cytobacillus kochii]
MIFLAILLMVCGLFIINGIYAYQTKHIDAFFLSTLWYYIKLVPLFIAASLMIGYGVKFLSKHVDNLSFSLIASKGIEILVSLIIGYLFFKETPTIRTGFGIVVILVGFWLLKGK